LLQKIMLPENQQKLSLLKTGIPGFDQLAQGGIPKGRSLLISGKAGTGKTVLLSSFLQQGIEKYEQNGVFVTFEERPEDIAKNVKGFGWNFDEHKENDRLAFVDLSPKEDQPQEVDKDYNLQPIIERIKYAVEKTNAERVAIDSIANLFGRFENEQVVRHTLFLLFTKLKEMGVTVFVSSEVGGPEHPHSRFGVEEYVADGVIQLETEFGENELVRYMSVLKIRGSGYRSGQVRYEINNDGLTIFPKISVDKSVFKISFDERKKFGIPKLDEALSGGVPKGHMMLVGGNTGTGKTTMGMHFLQEGVEQDENCVWVALEESVSQIKEVAKTRGWDLEKLEEEGKLTFVEASLLDISPDRLLADIIKAVDENDAERVLFDTISTLESAALDKEQVRQLLMQLASAFKSRGTTCILNYLTSEIFGASESQILGRISSNRMRLSSIVDGVILLRYREHDKGVEKLMTVLKLRGSAHDRGIFKYEIEAEGIVIEKRL
jgi:circadian clock protein KaiC